MKRDEYVKKKKHIVRSKILVLSMVLGSISIVSAASRTQTSTSPMMSVKSGSSAYGYSRTEISGAQVREGLRTTAQR